MLQEHVQRMAGNIWPKQKSSGKHKDEGREEIIE
jgi:hypothetical protein